MTSSTHAHAGINMNSSTTASVDVIDRIILGGAWQGKARLGVAGHGWARHGMAWRGMARHGTARHGKARGLRPRYSHHR